MLVLPCLIEIVFEAAQLKGTPRNKSLETLFYQPTHTHPFATFEKKKRLSIDWSKMGGDFSPSREVTFTVLSTSYCKSNIQGTGTLQLSPIDRLRHRFS